MGSMACRDPRNPKETLRKQEPFIEKSDRRRKEGYVRRKEGANEGNMGSTEGKLRHSEGKLRHLRENGQN